jgi:nitrogen-specific signal transduction histidine kinase/CheY-like chemotaxis protein
MSDLTEKQSVSPNDSRSGRPLFSLDHLRDKEVLSRLIHKIGHEIGNPLTSIISLATIIERFAPLVVAGANSEGGIETAKVSSYATSIIDESWRISNITEKLVLLLSQKPGGPSICDVGKCTQKALNKIKSRKKTDTSRVHLRLHGSEPPMVFIDPDQFIALVTELLDNAFQAIEYSEEGRVEAEPENTESLPADPEITLEASSVGNSTILAVHSLSKEPCSLELSTLFEPLITAYTDKKHIGIGLAMAYSIAQRADGEIEVRETKVNGCYQFTAQVRLPRQPKTTAAASTDAKGATAAEQVDQLEELVALNLHKLPPELRLFVVEDEATVCSAVCRILELSFAGKTKITCRTLSGQDAVCAIRNKEPFEVMICDLNLGAMSGRYVYETLVVEAPGDARKFAFITGEKARPETQLYLRTSGRPYLHKPFGPEELVALVLDLLGSAIE